VDRQNPNAADIESSSIQGYERRRLALTARNRVAPAFVASVEHGWLN